MSTSAAFSHESGPRLNAGLLEVFAGLALLIAAIGIYGVLSYVVNQRRQEIGVRMALGAGRGHVLALVLREGMGMALFGIAACLAVAFAVSRLLAALLFGMQARDAKQPHWLRAAFIQYSVTMLPITPKPLGKICWRHMRLCNCPPLTTH